MGKRARRKGIKRSAQAGLAPAATVVDECEQLIERGVAQHERETPARVADAILEQQPRPIGKADPPPVRDLRDAEQRLRELAMKHVEVVGTDDQERAIERGRRAELLGRSVRKLQRTPAQAPAELQRQLAEVNAELASASPIERRHGELLRRRAEVLASIETAGADRAAAFVNYQNRAQEVLENVHK